MIVALRALHCCAHEGIGDRGHHVVAVQVSGNFAIDFRFRHFSMANEIPRPCREKSERLNTAWARPGNHIAGNLECCEVFVWHIPAKRANQPVAVRPCIGSLFIFVVAVGVAIVRHVEP